MRNPNWIEDVWLDARAIARKETGIEDLPEACSWTMELATDVDFWPE